MNLEVIRCRFITKSFSKRSMRMNQLKWLRAMGSVNISENPKIRNKNTSFQTYWKIFTWNTKRIIPNSKMKRRKPILKINMKINIINWIAIFYLKPHLIKEKIKIWGETILIFKTKLIWISVPQALIWIIYWNQSLISKTILLKAFRTVNTIMNPELFLKMNSIIWTYKLWIKIKNFINKRIK